MDEYNLNENPQIQPDDSRSGDSPNLANDSQPYQTGNDPQYDRSWQGNDPQYGEYRQYGQGQQGEYRQGTYQQYGRTGTYQPYGQYQQYSRYDPYQKADNRTGSWFGIVAMILGISSLVLFCTCVNIPLAITAIVFAALHLSKSPEKKGMAIAGIVTAALSIVAFGIMVIGMLPLLANYSYDILDSPHYYLK